MGSLYHCLNFYLSTDTSSNLKNMRGKRPILSEHQILKWQNQVLPANVLAGLQHSFHFRHHHAHMHGIYHPSTIFPPSWPLKMQWATKYSHGARKHHYPWELSPAIQKYESKGLDTFFIALIFYLIVYLPFFCTFIFCPIRSLVQTHLILLKAVQSNPPLTNKKNYLPQLVTGKWEHKAARICLVTFL